MQPEDDGIEYELNRPRFIVMSGPYCAGKSTWSKALVSRSPQRHWVRISPEENLELIAHENGITSEEVYNTPELYQRYVQEALETLRQALEQGANVVYDGTNIRPEFRAKLLEMAAKVDHDYHCTAVVMKIDAGTANARLAGRNSENKNKPLGQQISMKRMETHRVRYEDQPLPTRDEGFDLIVTIPAGEIKKNQWRDLVMKPNVSQELP